MILGLILSIVLVLIPQNSFALTDAGSAYNWFWKAETVKCTVTTTVGVDYGLVATYSETYQGTKTACRDGNNWCWSGFCK